MRSSKIALVFAFLTIVAGCGGGGGGDGGSSSSGSSPSPSSTSAPAIPLPNGSSIPQLVGNNVLTLTVGGSECSAATLPQWLNKACVSVTICDPVNPTNCQTINDILLDTGDYGLRIFQQAITVPGLLTALGQNQVEVNSLPLYECTEYGDGSSVWGPVQKANLFLGGEPAVEVPIQVIGSATPDLINGNRHACSGAFSDPTQSLYNGSLGLGLFAQDCGDDCAQTANNGAYYTCSGGTCTGAAPSLASQVQNPVPSLPVDNNGVILMLPAVPSGGASSAAGYVVLGIGTQSNNRPAAGVVAYGANSAAEFTTLFNGTSLAAFLDSGSNGLFFPDSAIQTCGGWYCPPGTLTLSATTVGASGLSASGAVTFQISNYATLINSSNNAFSDLGGPEPTLFDWGVPFFLGRNVYVGIEGASSVLGTGPYWAY